ncbi:DUF4279 domain-containing protein [Nonomuraea sp. NPDC050153]|uniref:DUF4279 domain-containing protein n=1 Tax=Nonomuraea sp. NPDC050153 TaxID=3364359 RepID=UPI0037A07F2B
MPVDDMIAVLIDRLEPFGEAIGMLAEELDRVEPGNTAVLQVVRFFGDEEESTTVEEACIPGVLSPRPLGWHLDRRVLRFLKRTRAELDVDEYGDTT